MTSVIRDTQKLIKRYKNGKENFHSITLRAAFLPNRYRLDPVSVVDESWDVLIVLDACNFDHFKEISHIDGKLSKIPSKGTHTVEWMRENFDRDCSDIVYVAGNPQVSRTKLKNWVGVENPFYHLEPVWKDEWNEKRNTQPPGPVSDAARELHSEFPDKRLIVHYLQPHHPFIGEETPSTTHRQNQILNSMNWRPIFDELSLDTIEQAFHENLRIVLDDINDLLSDLSGDIVITADHGEAFGEYGLYGHVPGLYAPSMVFVPWLEVES
ncbi:hypothetical protein [Halosimplex pelagicum]|uniref:Sulfatase-like hydrolase/transferase n=1 Tax=Halosimplex pelagicum TaxID=869886 RepID=A0A7D5TBG1_9EURY|nr:hypothetical protein [Halosimplex pelagicum]QLH81275.1 hypothetical protein HZS54_06330 [Halosimplex pelagicum]